jgi:hypothetical protein
VNLRVPHFVFMYVLLCSDFNSLRKMINVHHMYNKGTTPLSHGVGSTHYGAHPCERGVVHLLYMWCTGITSHSLMRSFHHSHLDESSGKEIVLFGISSSSSSSSSFFFFLFFFFFFFLMVYIFCCEFGYIKVKIIYKYFMFCNFFFNFLF